MATVSFSKNEFDRDETVTVTITLTQMSASMGALSRILFLGFSPTTGDYRIDLDSYTPNNGVITYLLNAQQLNIPAGSYYVSFHDPVEWSSTGNFTSYVSSSPIRITQPLTGIFTNANKVMINNKRVGSIVCSDNNAVLYKIPLSISSNKNILSSLNNETATINVSYDKGANKIIEMYDSTNNFLGNMTDEGNGDYSFVYQSGGVGDINCYASVDGYTSQTIMIEDYVRYDTGAIDQTSSIPINNPNNGAYSFTHDTDHYVYSTNNHQKQVELIFADINSGDTDLLFEFDAKATEFQNTANGYNSGFWMFDPTNTGSYIRIGTWSSSKFAQIVKDGTSLYSSNPSGYISKNIWFTHRIRKRGDSILAEIVDTSSGNRIVGGEVSQGIPMNEIICKFFAWNGGARTTYHIRNIKVKKI